MNRDGVRSRLLLGFGNPSRGDDALGPELLERVAATADGDWELLTDFQLQIEHALDLRGRELVLFADAAASGPSPYGLGRLAPCRDRSYTTHALSPVALLGVFEALDLGPAPPCFVLSIRGYGFALGQPLSRRAERNLAAAAALTGQLMQRPLAVWKRVAGS